MRTKTSTLIFPHQLFLEHPALREDADHACLIEDALFFGDTHHPANMHQQKLWYHRASMKRHEAMLGQRSVTVEYFEHADAPDPLRACLEKLKADEISSVAMTDPHDFLLNKRVRNLCARLSIELEVLDTPMFLNTPSQNRDYRDGRKRWFMADFYKHQRRRLQVLMDGDDPAGGKWSFDEENRKKVPRNLLKEIPELLPATHDEIDLQARTHVLEHYATNPGALDQLIYPTSHEAAEAWLTSFLEHRFSLFGTYEDAMVNGQNWLWHGVLTPMLNTGLLTPQQVMERTLEHAEKNDIPINSVEGFIRQLIGWREFMRATYEDLGTTMRNANHWNHVRSMPACFYNASTGIDPIDDVLGRIQDTGYCHHIERLMVLGGFMFLCEIAPDEIHRWFMEMFVDSYDWVMVPNVYGMSQHADGGLITTKPYFSGSAYIRKMSNHPPGDWTATWDGLYWRWIWNHVDELAGNPRWAMMCSMARKMDSAKRDAHIEAAESFLAGIS